MPYHGEPAAFLLNGKRVELRDTAPDTTLLDFVRSRGLTGAKEGCAEGECGACAVLTVKSVAGKTTFVPVNSCLLLTPMVAGSEVYTVEALACAGRLAEVQQAMVQTGGSQCGYCTPGFVVSMFAEQARAGGHCNLDALSGNLCRCTGYRPIRDALATLGSFDDAPMRQRLSEPVAMLPGVQVRLGDKRFTRPATLNDCLELAGGDPSARFVGGNTDLGVAANLRNWKTRHLISTECIQELRQFRNAPDEVEIGAALTLGEIEALWHDAPRLIREWLLLFASPLIRNRATLGGNLATASPIGDAAPVLLALNAEVRIASLQGERLVPIDEFFLAYRRTALQAGEILQSVLIPKPFPAEAVFYKIAKRRCDDISTVAVCVAVSFGPARKLRDVRIALGGVGPMPIRARIAEQTMENTFGEEEAWAAAKNSLLQSLQPISDHRGSAAYRLAMVQSMLDKFRFERMERAAA